MCARGRRDLKLSNGCRFNQSDPNTNTRFKVLWTIVELAEVSRSYPEALVVIIDGQLSHVWIVWTGCRVVAVGLPLASVGKRKCRDRSWAASYGLGVNRCVGGTINQPKDACSDKCSDNDYTDNDCTGTECAGAILGVVSVRLGCTVGIDGFARTGVGVDCEKLRRVGAERCSAEILRECASWRLLLVEALRANLLRAVDGSRNIGGDIWHVVEQLVDDRKQRVVVRTLRAIGQNDGESVVDVAVAADAQLPRLVCQAKATSRFVGVGDCLGK